MPVSIEVRGAEQMRALGKRLRAAGLEGKGLRRELLAAMRVAEKEALLAAKESALQNLPKAGGLNEWVASSKFQARNRLTGNGVGVELKATKPGGSKGTHDLDASDGGQIRHRVYGHWRKGVPTQQIAPGWWSKPMTKAGLSLQIKLTALMARIARQIQE